MIHRLQSGSNGEWKEEKVDDPYSDRHTIELSAEEPFRPYEVQVCCLHSESKSVTVYVHLSNIGLVA